MALRVALGLVLLLLLAAPSGQVREPGSGATRVTLSGPTLFAGTLAATTTAAALGSAQGITKVLIQNDPDSAVDVLCGNSTTQSIQLTPGDGLALDVMDVALVFCKAVSDTATVGWIAR